MAIADNCPYRVFLSYASEDHELASKLETMLGRDIKEKPETKGALGLQLVWDRNIQGGQRFREAIQNGIAHSHAFIPLITPRSVESSWVHHEIGYALGRHVPVLTDRVGKSSSRLGGMPDHIHALRGNNIEAVKGQLDRPKLSLIQLSTMLAGPARYPCTSLQTT